MSTERQSKQVFEPNGDVWQGNNHVGYIRSDGEWEPAEDCPLTETEVRSELWRQMMHPEKVYAWPIRCLSLIGEVIDTSDEHTAAVNIGGAAYTADLERIQRSEEGERFDGTEQVLIVENGEWTAGA